MDTDGHSECAEVGAKILQAALKRSGREGWRTSAFYLGNWITDVSQAVDPVAYDRLAYDVPDLIVAIAAKLNNLELLSFKFFDIDLNKLRIRAEATLAVFKGGRDAKAGKAIKRGFKWIAYHKFVHADARGGGRMDFAAFERVFDEQYTQYYPHEHLDRWPANPSAPGDDITQVYPYLADDIKIVAGLIAQIDLEWASKAFIREAKNVPWKDDTDPAWNLWVAKLGHALHAVEDFFSHSNFIEHAIEALAPDDPRRDLKPADKFTLIGPSAAEIFKRRQTRYSEPQSDSVETHIVTGYFDLADTLFSFEHVVDELFPGRDKTPKVTTNGTRAGRILRDVLEEVQRRTKDMKVVSEADARAISKAVVTEKLRMKDPEYGALMSEANVPAAIHDTFHDAVAGLSARTDGKPMSVFEVILLLQSMADIKSYPQRFLTWLLGDTVAKTVDILTDPLIEAAKPLIRGVFEGVLGRYRVGCHSLLAKDYEWEDRPKIDAIYTEAKKCSKEVHNYIVTILTRWGLDRTAAVKRTDPKGDASAFNRLRLRLWVDWLELLRYFLRHPVKTEAVLADAWWYAILHGKEGSFRHYVITEEALRAQIQSADVRRKAGEAAYVPPPHAKVAGSAAVAGAGEGVGRAAGKALLATGTGVH